jgi:hypothetical protein
MRGVLKNVMVLRVSITFFEMLIFIFYVFSTHHISREKIKNQIPMGLYTQRKKTKPQAQALPELVDAQLM